jgi:hypothetical protein
MSDGHIFNTFWRPAARVPHSSLYPFPSLFAFPSAGEVDKIVLPEGMQSVSFEDCSGITGKAEILDG